MSTFDNAGSLRGARIPQYDPCGEAALLLTESLIHGLIACDALSVDRAVEILDGAIESQVEIAVDRGEVDGEPSLGLGILRNIRATLIIDGAL